MPCIFWSWKISQTLRLMHVIIRASDLRDSCLNSGGSCQCHDAKRRLLEGQIKCSDGTPLVKQCPKKCDVCKICLGDVLEGFCDGSPSPSPTPGPSVLTSHPSATPSFTPTVTISAKPSVHPTSSPSVSPTASPSSKPSPSPTNAPTPIHSVSPTSNPTIDDFDLDVCDTYMMDW